jgi:hypothetical protein
MERDIFEDSHETYGSPRITEELRAKGWTIPVNLICISQSGFSYLAFNATMI